MKRILLILCTLSLCILASLPAQAGDLVISLSGLHPGSPVYIRLHNTAAHFESGKDPFAKIVLHATAETAQITLHDLPNGRYAAAAFQDVDQNEHLSTSFLGLPSEPYGFSNKSSSADFDAAAFEINSDRYPLSLPLHN